MSCQRRCRRRVWEEAAEETEGSAVAEVETAAGAVAVETAAAAAARARTEAVRVAAVGWAEVGG